jgi:hypothetical protein
LRLVRYLRGSLGADIDVKLLPREQKTKDEMDLASTFVDTYRSFLLAMEVLRKSTLWCRVVENGVAGREGRVRKYAAAAAVQRDLALAS